MTDHETVGEIAGHEVTVSVSGPEAQDLDGNERIGSDVLINRINEKLTELKQSEDTSMETTDNSKSTAGRDENERIPYGDETRGELPDGTPLYLPRESETCPDCAVERGELHARGCDTEQCPECKRQLISCPHARRFLRPNGYTECFKCGADIRRHLSAYKPWDEMFTLQWRPASEDSQNVEQLDSGGKSPDGERRVFCSADCLESFIRMDYSIKPNSGGNR